ncbi:unnamed protein product [Owenia fusiformis]|uniref:Hexosyltransferase n=1 Tax=Owenia fusiformis TaxID=6347 RepID=A0A8S4NG39_OWEFU|nr:unnamed protein product [Owenia fusiformis]
MSGIRLAFLIVLCLSSLSIIAIGLNLLLPRPVIKASNRRTSEFESITDEEKNISTLIDLLRNTLVNLNESVTTKAVHAKKALKPTARPDQCVSCFPKSSYIFPNYNVCSTEHPRSQDVKLLLLIFTTHEKTRNRKALRKTWTSIAENNTARVRYVFLLGKHDDHNWNKKALAEAKHYGDIVISDFREVYKNLTLKTISGFQWAAGFCPNAKYIMKTDDDMWVNTPKLLKNLDRWHISKEVVGFCLPVDDVHREKDSRWYVSPLEYPHSKYPGFCSGTGYVTTMSVMQAIVGVSPHIPYFFLEDIYVAICIKKLGYTLRRLRGFYNDKVPFDPCMYQQMITSHNVTMWELEEAWSPKCSGTDIAKETYHLKHAISHKKMNIKFPLFKITSRTSNLSP